MDLALGHRVEARGRFVEGQEADIFAQQRTGEGDPLPLSAGQQQRVAIVRALINEPALLLADEPAGNLDSAIGKGIVDLLLRLNAEQGTTLVLATHDMDIAARCARTINMRDGRITNDDRTPVARGPPPRLRSAPRTSRSRDGPKGPRSTPRRPGPHTVRPPGHDREPEGAVGGGLHDARHRGSRPGRAGRDHGGRRQHGTVLPCRGTPVDAAPPAGPSPPGPRGRPARSVPRDGRTAAGRGAVRGEARRRTARQPDAGRDHRRGRASTAGPGGGLG
ncbi:ATP-binding cassette domain-containing protein [Streptomyces sp. NBC_00727]|uniref:ATP-binding cassette domain-containing protein n=1 Tax=Streptomyces sp. NBC_00727 TaxID=2903675 RepID=UPI003862E301